jgi:hypothetical protein
MNLWNEAGDIPDSAAAARMEVKSATVRAKLRSTSTGTFR